MNTIRNHARASAPAKVILFGEHFVVYGKPAILASIDRRVHVAVGVRKDDKFVVQSNIGFTGTSSLALAPDSKTGGFQKKPFKALVRPIVTAAVDAMKEFNAKIGLDIKIRSDFPYGVGLGSSAACSVATIAAVGALFGKLSREKISEISLNAERLVHNNPSGADSAICTYGGLMLFRKNNGAKPINSKIDLNLIVVNSGVRRISGKLVTSVREKQRENAKLFAGLARMSEEITTQALEAIETKDYSEIGALMTLNHSLLRRLGVSRNLLDSLVARALDNGALGAKITGAGGGGCIIALPEKKKSSLNKLVKALKEYDFYTSRSENKGVVVHN